MKLISALIMVSLALPTYAKSTELVKDVADVHFSLTCSYDDYGRKKKLFVENYNHVSVADFDGDFPSSRPAHLFTKKVTYTTDTKIVSIDMGHENYKCRKIKAYDDGSGRLETVDIHMNEKHFGLC